MKIRVFTFLFVVTLMAGGHSTFAQNASPESGSNNTAALCPIPDQPIAVPNATPVAQSPDSLTADEIAKKLGELPESTFPARLTRDADSGSGVITLTLPAPFEGSKVTVQATSGAAGLLGRVTREDHYVVFAADHLTYDLAAAALPGGLKVGQQSLDLDQDHANTLCIDLLTGKITRHFRWIVTSTNVTFNGKQSLVLDDRARVEVLAAGDNGDGRYILKLRTHWKSDITLDTWTVDGKSMPGGKVTATALFEDTYFVETGES